MTAFKRIISFLLAFVLLIGAVPVNVAASETEPTLIPEETTAPTAETTEPTEEPTAPTEETTAPTEEPTVPTEEPTVPTEETTAPTEAPTVPTEEPTEPTVAPMEPEEAADDAATATGIAVDETNFPDANFRSYILARTYGADGVLTEEELAKVTQILVSEADIASLKGIEHFTALTELYCDSNQLTELDVSKNPALTKLYCYDNQLTVLDVSKNPALTKLSCLSNQLTELDVSKNPALTELYCYNNQLTALDVSNHTELTELHCYANQLTGLDVSRNTKLTELDCSNNQLTELDVSRNTQLTILACVNNQLTSLDLSNNSALTTCICNNNSRAITVDAKNQFDLTTLPGFDVTRASSWEGGTVSGNTLTAAAETITYTYDLGNGTTETFTLTTTLNEETPDGVLVNEENFPDANFRSYILAQTYGADGVLTQEELTSVNAIFVNKKGIASLKGIEYFTALTHLECSENVLTALDVTKNTALTGLFCFDNLLTALDVRQNTALTNLRCYSNQLTALDVSNNTALTYLNCCSNQLTALDVTNNAALATLECSTNLLTALDTTNNTALTDLHCNNNQLTELDVTNNTALTNLYCNNNQLTALDVTRNAALKLLSCRYNQLTALNVNGNTALTELYCNNNQLTALDVSKNTILKSLYCGDNQLTALDVSNNIKLTNLSCIDNQLTALDVSRNTALINLYCGDNRRAITVDTKNQFDLSTLPGFDVAMASSWVGGTVSGSTLTATAKTISYTYDLGNGKTETFTLTTTLNEQADVLVNEANFPDANFRSYILSQSYGEDGVLTEEELATVTQIDVSDAGIRSLKGIEHFTALTDLVCYWNQLTELDLSGNTELTYLHCGVNELTELNVSGNTKLTRLYCNDNYLTELDVSKNPALTDLVCYGNQLTELDLSKNPALTYLDCEYNQLIALDLSKNTALNDLDCYGNSREITLDANNQFDLSTLPGFDVTRAVNWYGAVVRGTILTAYQETITYYYKYRDNESTQFKLTTTLSPDAPSYDVQVNAENFPDANFRSYILSQTYGADGVLTLEELADIEYMHVTGKGIASLKGIEHFVALTNLYCGNNSLSTLDVSHNSALGYLSCGNNSLSILDVSGNPALTDLWCSDNLLTTLDVSGSPALIRLYCGNNLLSSLDVSSNPALTVLNCSNNQLAALDVSGSSALTGLYCGDNLLSSLDVSKNPTLTNLSCSNNLLITLNVSRNPALTVLYCSNNQLTSLDVSGSPALTQLQCHNNQLTTLDVSRNPSLSELHCGENRLTALNVSSNPALKQLNCGDNRLTALNVTGNPALVSLYCYDNQLTTLDVSRNTALTSLNCSDNQLTTLDVSKNAKLQSLYCGNNQLTSLDLRNNPQCTYVGAYNNQKNITVNSKKKFDLSTLPGFDVTRASSWKGGRVSGNILTVNQEYISYEYQLGNGERQTFHLYAENMAITVQISGNANTGKPKLTWNKVIGAAKYQIYRSTGKHGPFTLLSTVTGTSYTDNKAVAGKLYYYMVQPIDAKGHGNQASNTVSRRCDLARPSITVSGVSSTGKIKVSWKAISGAKSYKVYRSTSEDGEYTLMKTTTSTSYTNTSAKAGTRYYYKVMAVHSNSAANSAYSAVKSRVCDLARPTVTLSSVASTGKIKVSWKAITGTEYYAIYRATGKGGTYKYLVNVTETSFTDNETVAGKTYYYQVVAVHSNTNANSAKSTAVSRVCDLARPDVEISLSGKGKPRLTWEGIEGATKYEVYRATSKTGKYTLVKTTTSTSFTNTGAKKGTTYYYKVKAIHSNTNANSAYSLVDSIRSQ